MDSSDFDSSVISLTITTHTVCYSDVFEWILDTYVTYHVCPKQDWFVSFEKFDDGMVQMGDDFACNMGGVGTVLIKIFDGMVRDLKDVRYIPQIKKNIIAVGALEAQSLEFF